MGGLNRPILSDLSEAITWARERWDRQRPVPVRLHEARTTEGALGAPRFSHAFASALDANPASVMTDAHTQPCGHPLLAGSQATRDCPECFGIGIKDVTVDRYRYPMTLALSRLSNALPVRRTYPHPYLAIVTLAEHGWDAHATARSLDLGWDMAEAHLLRSLRQLHSRYQEGPIARVSWVEKSSSQQNAESWSAA